MVVAACIFLDMITVGEIGEKKSRARKKARPKSHGSTKRAREDANDRAKKKRQAERVASMTKKAAKIGKVSANGKRICLWEDCNIVLSMYNYGECCSKHQMQWSIRNGVRHPEWL